MLIDKLLKFYHGYWKKRLTILAYHRIVTDDEFQSSSRKIAVSASISEFERQMCFVKQHFSIITLEKLEQWLQGKADLPERALLVTFDDGYQDLFSLVMPVLERLKIPATVFLASDFMGSNQMFQWDKVGYYFEHTALTSATLPLLGECAWASDVERNSILKQWLTASKKQTDSDKHVATEALGKALQVNLPAEEQGLDFLTWNQVRLLMTKGFSFGSHTCQHPILSKIPYDQLLEELIESKQKIELETSKEVLSFAYPNGLADDFNAQVIKALAKVGYLCAFTLLPGPVYSTEAKKQPFEIQRVTITDKDYYRRFIFKLMGLVRIKQKLKRGWKDNDNK